MPDQPLRNPIIVTSLYGSSSIESGEAIKVAVKLFGEGDAELIIPVAEAVELLGLLGAGLADAAQKRATGKANHRGRKH